MIIISSSAKTLDLDSPIPNRVKMERVPFLKEAEAVQKVLGEMDVPEFSKVLHVSDKIAILNVERMQNWSKAEERPALFCYKGDVFRELHPGDYSAEQLAYAGRSVHVMSGLYGVVAALQGVKPYRLEMKADLKGYGPMNLYWRDKVTDYLNKEANKHGHKFLLNLASKEYSKAVDPERLQLPIVNVDFKEERDGKLKIVGLFAKRARGMMIDYCIQNQIEDPADLRHFNAAGYEFVGEENNTLTFVR